MADVSATSCESSVKVYLNRIERLTEDINWTLLISSDTRSSLHYFSSFLSHRFHVTNMGGQLAILKSIWGRKGLSQKHLFGMTECNGQAKLSHAHHYWWIRRHRIYVELISLLLTGAFDKWYETEHSRVSATDSFDIRGLDHSSGNTIRLSSISTGPFSIRRPGHRRHVSIHRGAGKKSDLDSVGQDSGHRSVTCRAQLRRVRTGLSSTMLAPDSPRYYKRHDGFRWASFPTNRYLQNWNYRNAKRFRFLQLSTDCVKMIVHVACGLAHWMFSTTPWLQLTTVRFDHLLHGSASNVVRTGRSVNGNRPKLTPSRSETPW
jgi:hypothetical protein